VGAQFVANTPARLLMALLRPPIEMLLETVG
jgi:hypothetical protein